MSDWFVITGSSKGVGLEICRLLLENDSRVVGISRSPGPFIDHKSFKWIECDLAIVDNVRHAARRISDISTLDLKGLVFNAAAGYYGNSIEMASDELDRLIAVNFKNQIILLQHLIIEMRKKPEIFYISSSASRIPAPMMAAYAATKAAFESFIMSVAMEWDLKVHIVRPAEIDTGFSQDVGVPSKFENNIRKLLPRKVAEDALSMLGTRYIFRNIGHRAVLMDLAVRIWPSILFKRPSNHIKK